MLIALCVNYQGIFAGQTEMFDEGFAALANIEVQTIDSQIKAETDKRIATIMKNYGAGDYRDYLLAKLENSMARFKAAVLESKKIKKQHRKFISPVILKLDDVAKNVVWNKDHTAVLMLSLVPVGSVERFGYEKALKGDKVFKTPSWSNENTIYCWVTLVPQIKEFGLNYIKENNLFEPTDEKKSDRKWYMKDRIKLTDRINEYLGLIPFSEDYTWSDIRAVEMWVKPEDLFRPCENPDPKAEACTLKRDQMYNQPEIMDGKIRFDFSTFLGAKKVATWSTSPFPWTNWGFTYDWGITPKDPKNPTSTELSHIGATEFVIKPDSKVIFQEKEKSFPSLEHYCQENTTPKTGTVDVKMP